MPDQVRHDEEGMAPLAKIPSASRVKLLALGFTLYSAALLFWLFANWFDWSMAELDCRAGYWACRRELIGPMTIRVGLPVLAWVAFAILLARESERG